MQQTTGYIPSNRDAFSAVLSLDNKKVIIYGGRNFTNSSDSLYVLNVETWEWYIPNVFGTYPTVITHSHRSVVVGNYMVITFGKY